jgi:hypothetical protein
MTNPTHVVASFTFRTATQSGYHNESFSVLNLDGRLMIHTGDELLNFDSFLSRNGTAVCRILREFRGNPQLLDGSEVRLTHRLRRGRRIVSILGGPLHGRQF